MNMYEVKNTNFRIQAFIECYSNDVSEHEENVTSDKKLSYLEDKQYWLYFIMILFKKIYPVCIATFWYK